MVLSHIKIDATVKMFKPPYFCFDSLHHIQLQTPPPLPPSTFNFGLTPPPLPPSTYYQFFVLFLSQKLRAPLTLQLHLQNVLGNFGIFYRAIQRVCNFLYSKALTIKLQNL